MNQTFRWIILTFTLILQFAFIGCRNSFDGPAQSVTRLPLIFPDYSEVTIPYNIAPLNFMVKEKAVQFRAVITSAKTGSRISQVKTDGIFQFKESAWKKLLAESKGNKLTVEISVADSQGKVSRYLPFTISVAADAIDPYMAYRLIYPGYYSWSDIKIEQRSLESFENESLIENQVVDKNCVNCHSFNQNNPDQFLLHMRGSNAGTYIVENGKIKKTNLKTENMSSSATYPYWHPGGRFVAFSSNVVKQSFYAQHDKSIEVYDQSSSLVLYDILKNEISSVPKEGKAESLQTFPAWSPDGKSLYFCEAIRSDSLKNWEISDLEQTHYNLVRKSFNETDVSFGKTETVVDASADHKSISFPRISPDGKYLVYTMGDYGTFPIWHQEADLYMLELQSGKVKKLEINSDETDSYHSWSSNGKWLVFSSKRIDGRSTRPYIAYINSWDEVGKPFVLPQEDPAYYDNLVQSYNIPELIKGRVKLVSNDFVEASKSAGVQALQGKFFPESPALGQTSSQSDVPYLIHE